MSQHRTVLLTIDIQDGFTGTHFAFWGPSRSNPSFESNAASLIDSYRDLVAKTSAGQHRVIHIQHASMSPTSPLHPSAPGFKFQFFATPQDGELVMTKSVNSAFIGTDLEKVLKEHFAGASGKLFIIGLTTDHCVSTSTRMAGNLGVCDAPDGEKGEVVLVGDATAAWAKGVGGDWADAETVHKVHIQSLQNEFATIEKTDDVKKLWEGWAAGN